MTVCGLTDNSNLLSAAFGVHGAIVIVLYCTKAISIIDQFSIHVLVGILLVWDQNWAAILVVSSWAVLLVAIGIFPIVYQK
jgi:hypothetical protein